MKRGTVERNILGASSARRRWRLIGIAVALALVPIIAIEGMAAVRSTLWRVVHDLCVADQRLNGKPAPCVEVNLAAGEANGYVVLKDLLGTTQFLLIPTRRIAGIESPELLIGETPNYWQDAWKARRYVERSSGGDLPRDAIGMAINAATNRSQDQLHIHIDCVRPDVRGKLARHASAIGETWSALPFRISGQMYMARRVNSPDLDGIDPFRLLADGIEAARQDMAAETLVVIGATFGGGRPGFVLLADHADGTRPHSGHGEDVLDHQCVAARSRTRDTAR